MLRRLRNILRPQLDQPGVFYSILLATLCAIQLLNLFLFLRGGEAVRTLIPAYTQALSITIGTVFLFRGLQMLGALIWAALVGAEAPPAP